MAHHASSPGAFTALIAYVSRIAKNRQALIREASAILLMGIFFCLWHYYSLPTAINALVAVGTLGMAYFSFALNRHTVMAERRHIKPMCYCEPVADRENFPRHGVAPKAFFYQKRDGKEIESRDLDSALILQAEIWNNGTGPACNVRLCLASPHLGPAGCIWTEWVPVAPAIFPSVVPWTFEYQFTEAAMPRSGVQKRSTGEPSSIAASVQDLWNNVSAIYLQYEDIEGNIYHSSLSLLTRPGHIDDPDYKKFQGREPITQFGDGKLPIRPWYAYDPTQV